MINLEPVRTYIVENFLFGDDETFADDTSFLQTGLIDSVGIMELIAFLEGQFQIKIEDHELIPDNLDSIDRIAAFIQKKSENTSTHQSK
jgi:acyl carrier protein